MEIYLNDIQKLSNTKAIVEFISDIYANSEGTYIPALISEGNFIGDLNADFYVKLILKHKELPVNRTWLVNNLQFSLPTFLDIKELSDDNNQELFIHNLIVFKNYRNASVYQLNPLLTATELYQEEGVKNLKYVEAYYEEEYQSKKGSLIFDYDKKGNNEYINILKSFLTQYVNYEGQQWENAYELVAEFEYRNKNHKPMEQDFSNSSSGFIDYYHGENGLYLRGSIVIPFNYSKSSERAIQVIDLHTGEVRSHNPNNYNGDTEEGFIVFSKEAVNLLKQDYFFYDIQLIEKKYLDNSVLVDYLGDRVIFWEAEYNKLPSQLKNNIDQYNIIPEDNRVISKAMHTMQLEASWHWEKDLEPDKKLAYMIKSKMFERAIDKDLNFVYPQNKMELQSFIQKIESLTEIKLEEFNTSVDEVRLLINFRNGCEESNIPVQYIEELYLKYCFAIGEVFGGKK